MDSVRIFYVFKYLLPFTDSVDESVDLLLSNLLVLVASDSIYVLFYLPLFVVRIVRSIGYCYEWSLWWYSLCDMVVLLLVLSTS